MKFSIKYSILYLLLITYPLSPIKAQSHFVDSLRRLLKTEKEDSNKMKNLSFLANNLYYVNPDSTILLAQQSMNIAEQLHSKKWDAIGYQTLGIGYYVKGDYNKGLENLQIALKMNTELGRKKQQIQELGNIGNIYDDEGDLPKALDYDLKALKIADETGDEPGQASTLGNVGIIYMEEHNYPMALDYCQKAIKLCREIKDRASEVNNLGNIGIIFEEQHNYAQAIEFDWEALKIFEELHNKQGQSRNLSNIGVIYFEMRDYAKALENAMKALKINQELGNKRGEAINLSNIGTIYTKTGKFKEAEEYLKNAIALDSTIGEKDNMQQTEIYMSELYDTTGHYNLALTWYKKATILKDTLFNIEKDKALTRKELTYKFEHQKDSAKAVQKEKDAVHEEETKKQRIAIYSISIGLFLVLSLALTIYRSLQMNRSQTRIILAQKQQVENKNILIEQQKAEVEKKNEEIAEKNKDIIDSITYAKRLQEAILPQVGVIKKYLPESFVLYKPKDIVAGDFYWFEKLEDTILIAACDCTGHGVPGAMVSVVCSNALNQALNEFKIRDTGKMLDKVREMVLETFEKSEGEVKDGMDCSFCAINTKAKKIEWSGAYNPLWYIQNGELKELAPDKQPIGKHDNPVPFTTHRLNLQKGDILYLFTDGYADQFGGPKGKKFKYKQLQQVITDNAQLTMEEQKNVLEKTLVEWRGNLEQVDDILIIGIRV